MSDNLFVLAILALVLVGPALLVANILTLADMVSVAPHAWPAARLSRRRWAAVACASVVLLPLGLAVIPLWRLRLRPRLEETVPGSVRPFFKRGPTIFDAATTWYSRLFRFALVVLAVIGIGLGMPKLLRTSVGDPSHVSITDASHDIAPKSWIEQHCKSSVVRALHLDNPVVEENGHDYQRWTVTPKYGHVDRVLLDVDSGRVICP
ncbi:hypothetical protein [Peterkaempfera sp. SMS 1(5)a]|uniref:hypothetical protein n=1 Tax=Peterkaempfera podocarpi TaxID=3232308 RepID=UPI003672163A